MFYLILRMFHDDLMEGRISPSSYEALLLQAAREHEILRIQEELALRGRIIKKSS